MARYYAEGTIKKIVIENDKIQFALDPAERFYDELNDKKRIRLIGEEKGSCWKYFTGEFFASGRIASQVLQHANHNEKSLIRIYVDGQDIEEDVGGTQKAAEVKSLVEIKD